ncbi:MAG: BrnT family toxin [Pseudomonadota bacterium]
MKITYDENKREITLKERNLDFEDAIEVFSNETFEIEDKRKNYGETRIICYGFLKGRMVVIGYVQRGDCCHIFTMRKANEKEQKKIRQRLS